MPPYIAPEVKQRIGVWGAPTSTLDWCEENHVLTSFIAEFCMNKKHLCMLKVNKMYFNFELFFSFSLIAGNTLSNGFFIGLALLGVWASLKHKLEHAYVLCYLGLLGKWNF